MLVEARWFLASQVDHAAMVSHVSTGSFVVVAGIRDLAVSYSNGFAGIAFSAVSKLHVDTHSVEDVASGNKAMSR